MSCIFCKIVTRKVETVVLYEDDLVMAFLDIQPINEGHTLVIPKKHFKLLEDIDEDIYTRMFEVGRKILRRMMKTFPDVTAVNFIVANGEDAGQEIFHSHLHIIPRKINDGFGFKFGTTYGRKATIGERQKTAKIIGNIS